MSEAQYQSTSYERPEGAYAIYITSLDKKIGPNYGPRNKFIDRYFWRPHWEAEVTTALNGLNSKITDSFSYGGLKGAYFAWDNARRYRSEASDAVIALKSGEGAMEATANYLLATAYLDDYRFPPHNRGGRPTEASMRRTSEAVSRIRELDEGDLAMLGKLAFASEAERLRFWDCQLETVASTDIVLDIKDAIENAEALELYPESDDKI